MKFKGLWFIFLFLMNVQAFSQITYFVKYKSYISSSLINEKISTQSIFPQNQLKKSSANFKAGTLLITHFAWNLGSDDAVLSKIVKVIFGLC